ncbi:MAG: UPF0058 family protein [Halobacteriaceae archaeon]
MKKQELIHLHGLLAEAGTHFEENHDMKIDLTDYEEMGVRPTSIHKSKTDHKAAVFALVECLTDEFEAEAREPVAATAD